MIPEKTILVFTDWYYPAYKAGGPVQSVFNLVNLLSRHYQVKIVCRDRDLNSNAPFENMQTNVWKALSENQQIMYLNAAETSFSDIKSLISENRNNILYINGIYSLKFSLYPALMAYYYNIGKTYISVRGMLHRSALSVKPVRKQLFLAFSRGLGLYKKVRMLASDGLEAEEIKRSLGNVPVSVAPNIPMQPEAIIPRSRPYRGSNGQMVFLFMGRISPEKNPLMVVKAIKQINTPCSLHVCGADYNDAYSKQFKAALADLPEHINIQLQEEQPHHNISALYNAADVLLLPSLGENFGHAIFEAMLHGMPVIIGNNTPWKDLQEQKSGIEVEPTDLASICKAINFFNGMDAEEFHKWSSSAKNYAMRYLEANNFDAIYRKLFS